MRNATLTRQTQRCHDNLVGAVSILFSVGKVTRLGSQTIQLNAGIRYWAVSPDFGPDGVALWLDLVLLFPK